MTKYQRYNASAKGKARIARYRASVKGVLTRAKTALNQLTTNRRST